MLGETMSEKRRRRQVERYKHELKSARRVQTSGVLTALVSAGWATWGVMSATDDSIGPQIAATFGILIGIFAVVGVIVFSMTVVRDVANSLREAKWQYEDVMDEKLARYGLDA